MAKPVLKDIYQGGLNNCILTGIDGALGTSIR